MAQNKLDMTISDVDKAIALKKIADAESKDKALTDTAAGVGLATLLAGALANAPEATIGATMLGGGAYDFNKKMKDPNITGQLQSMEKTAPEKANLIAEEVVKSALGQSAARDLTNPKVLPELGEKGINLNPLAYAGNIVGGTAKGLGKSVKGAEDLIASAVNPAKEGIVEGVGQALGYNGPGKEDDEGFAKLLGNILSGAGTAVKGLAATMPAAVYADPLLRGLGKAEIPGIDTVINALGLKQGFFQSEDPAQRRLEAAIGQGDASLIQALGTRATKPLEVAKFKADTRKDFETASKAFATQAESFGRIENYMNKINQGDSPTKTDTLAMGYAFMKMLDPGSTVREGEFAMLGDGGVAILTALSPALGAIYRNAVQDGKFFDKTAAEDMFKIATNAFLPSVAQHELLRRKYGEEAVAIGLTPKDVIVEYVPEKTRQTLLNKVILQASGINISKLNDKEINKYIELQNKKIVGLTPDEQIELDTLNGKIGNTPKQSTGAASPVKPKASASNWTVEDQTRLDRYKKIANPSPVILDNIRALEKKKGGK